MVKARAHVCGDNEHVPCDKNSGYDDLLTWPFKQKVRSCHHVKFNLMFYHLSKWSFSIVIHYSSKATS